MTGLEGVTVEVTFSIRDPEGKWLEEEDIQARFAELRPALQSLDEAEGRLSIYNDDTTYAITTFKDELGVLVSTVCLDAVGDLAAGKAVRVSMVSHPQRIDFDVEGDQIVIHGDGIDGDRCPARPLLKALVACGERYAALLKKLHGGDPTWSKNLSGWDQGAARARASLA